VEQGKVSLDTPVSDYLPHLKNVGVVTSAQKPDLKATGTDITLMHVLNHSSGLFYGLERPDPIYLLPTPYSSSQDGEDAAGCFLDKIKVNVLA
jgi:CubicO group peptidase (beta-lactamase class C family)